MQERVVFLDIDGVLNNVHDGTSYLVHNPETYGLSETNLSVLEKILGKTGARVSVLSSWRKRPDDYVYRFRYGDTGKYEDYVSPVGKLYRWLSERSLFHPVIPIVPHIPKFRKYEDVRLWFERYGESGHDPENVSYVVLDDDRKQGLELLGERFYRVEPECGLEEKDVEPVSGILCE